MYQENTAREIILKSFIDEKSSVKMGLKNARNCVKQKGTNLYCLAASCEGEKIVTKTIKRFLNLTTFESIDGSIYEIVDSENEPIRCDVVRFVNSETEQETFHEAIAQKWLQEKKHVTAFIVTEDDAYRTSCILKVNWSKGVFITSSGRRYKFSE